MKNIYKVLAAITLGVLLAGCACHGIKDPVIRHANGTILPSMYPVYVSVNTAVNHPAPGFTQKFLPVDNFYRYSPGCYIACYSKNPNGSVYGVGQGYYVKGMVRVNGLYVGRICQPQGFFFKDISTMSRFSDLCQKRIKACKGDNCWAGGDTSGWFGIL